MRDQNIPSSSRKSLAHRGRTCLNCGTPLDISDRYCQHCGQMNTTKRLSLYDFFGEFMLSIFVYDSRFRYTVKDLLFKPGIITRNYIFGKRVRYANPFRFFLSVSILYFLLSGLLNFFEGNGNSINIGDDKVPFTDAAKISWKDKNRDEISATIDSLVKNTGKEDDEEKTYDFVAEKDLDTMSFSTAEFRKISLFREFYIATQIKEPGPALDSLNYAQTRYNNWLYSRNPIIERIEENPGAFISFLASKIPFFLFFFIPIFALFFLLLYFKWYPFAVIKRKVMPGKTTKKGSKTPVFKLVFGYLYVVFLWVFHVKRKANYMEHMIFIFHFFTFIFLVLLFCLIPDYFLGSPTIAWLFMTFIAPFYFYKALRKFYGEGRWLTVFKFLLLNFIFLTVGAIIGTFFFLGTATVY